MVTTVIMIAYTTTVSTRPSTTVSTRPSTTVIYDSILGGSCDSDTNCNGLVGNSMCLNGTCVCKPGYMPSGLTTCIQGEGKNNAFSILW